MVWLERVTMLITIVIPVYNVESLLRRCVHSVMEQTYRDLEIILVDDGSPDNSGKICDEMAEMDSRITVYHKPNGGLSDARNYGTERANGDFITFVDSDDYIAPDYVAYLLDLIVLHKADIACCACIRTGQDNVDFKEDTEPDVKLMSGYEAAESLLTTDLYNILITAWGKLYRADIVKKYPFPKGRLHEDEAVTGKYYYESGKVAVSHRRLYAYYQNPKGIMHTNGTKKQEDAVWSLKHRAEFFEEKDSRLASYAWGCLFFYLVQDSYLNDGRSNQKVRSLLKGKRLSRRTRLLRLMYMVSPKLYFHIRDVKRRTVNDKEREICGKK